MCVCAVVCAPVCVHPVSMCGDASVRLAWPVGHLIEVVSIVLFVVSLCCLEFGDGAWPDQLRALKFAMSDVQASGLPILSISLSNGGLISGLISLLNRGMIFLKRIQIANVFSAEVFHPVVHLL